MNKFIVFFGLIFFISFSAPLRAEIIYLKGEGLLKGQIEKKTSDYILVKIKYGTIKLTKQEVDKIEEDSNPEAIYDLARYHVKKEQWSDAVEEFDNLLLIRPDMRKEALKYISDINFSKSAEERLANLKSVSKAYKMIEEGKVLVKFGKKYLKYTSSFDDADKEFESTIRRIARKNIKKGKKLIDKGQATIDAYHKQRSEEIRRAREKAEQEKKEKEKK